MSSFVLHYDDSIWFHRVFEVTLDMPVDDVDRGFDKFDGDPVSLVDPDAPRYNDYFTQYADRSDLLGITMSNFFTRNRRSAFLFETDSGDSNFHIVWVVNADTPVHRPVPRERWRALCETPELLARVNLILAECYQEALGFYRWESIPSGLVVEDSTKFGMESGNVSGIRVSYQTLEALIRAITEANEVGVAEQEIDLAAQMVHELTHRQRDEIILNVFSEVFSHAAQFLFEPNCNTIFVQQCKESLQQFLINRGAEGAEDTENGLHLYDKAIYLALLIVLDTLVEHNQEALDCLKADEDPQKLNALGCLPELVKQSDSAYLRTHLLGELMTMTRDQLRTRLQEIESRHGLAGLAIMI